MSSLKIIDSKPISHFFQEKSCPGLGNGPRKMPAIQSFALKIGRSSVTLEKEWE
jgi:hypothetical protein